MIVILSGDNGPQPSFDRARTAGMRGIKWSLYEGGIRTPLIVRWPGVVPVAVNNTTVVGAVDFFPTLCALAAVTAPDGVKFDGENLAATWKGGKQPSANPLFWEYGRQPSADGPGKIRAFPYPAEPEAKSPNVAIRDGDWKFLVNADGSGEELFNLTADPHETKNVAESEPAIAARLKSVALTWRRALP